MQAPKSHRSLNDTAEERQLVAGLQSGDPKAFEALFRAYASGLAGFALSYLHAPDVAEDVVQAVFVSLWMNRHSLRPEHGLRAYLFAAVRNRALNFLRDEASQRRTAESIIAIGGANAPAADAHVVVADLHRQVRAIVAGMPPRCREVFLLLRTQALSYAEVASVLGIAPKTVEIHMSRALAILRARLGDAILD